MNRERAKELLPIIQAFIAGEIIQFRDRRSDGVKDPVWSDILNQSFFIDNLKPATNEYRVKPKPREWWMDPDDHEIWDIQIDPPIDKAIKVREVPR